jgi:hypothetical protein
VPTCVQIVLSSSVSTYISLTIDHSLDSLKSTSLEEAKNQAFNVSFGKVVSPTEVCCYLRKAG